MMKVSPFLRSAAGVGRVTLAVLAACVFAGSASNVEAADGHLNEGTVFVVSTDNWGSMRSSMDASDQGRFLNDPEIRRIRDSLEKGFMALIDSKMKEQMANVPEGVDAEKMQAVAKDAMAKLVGYGTSLCSGMKGRVALSLGILNDPSLPAPINLVFEFGGNDEIHAKNQELLDLILSTSEGQAARTSFEAHGYKFNGVHQMGMGVFVGRKGDRFIAGLHQAGLNDYLAALEAGTVRLGNDPFYKSATAAVGNGSVKSFLNMQPVWGMAMGMLAGVPVGEGEPSPMAVMQALGVTGFQGMASAGQCSATGTGQKTFIGMQGRSGLMRLVPTENKSLAPPPFAPNAVLSSTSMRLELSQILKLVRDVMVIAPTADRDEFEGGLAGVKEMLGFSVEELLSDLEGTVFYATPAGGPPPNPMAMMMGGGAGLDQSIALKLASKERFLQLINKFADPQISQGMVTKQAVEGREVWAVTLPMAPIQLAIAIEKDWLLIGTGVETMKKAFARADSDQGLATNAGYQGMVQKVGGSTGMMVTYKDSGKMISQTLDMFRPVVGMLPMFVPTLAQEPELGFLFDPSILPSSATVQKYFGETASRTRIVEGGMISESWAPSKSAGTKKAAGAGL